MTHEPTTQRFPVAKIIIPSGRRSVYGIQDLAESIETMGLIQPIGIRSDGTLIYGNRRYHAYLLKGWKEITVRVYPDTMTDEEAELMEIDENFQRQELTALQKAEQIARKKVLYEIVHPETVSTRERGGPGRGHKTNGDAPLVSDPPPFREVAMKDLGVKNPATVNRYIRTVERLTDEAKEIARGTSLEDEIEALHEISFLPADEQPAAAVAVIQGEVTRSTLADKRKAKKTEEEKPDWMTHKGKKPVAAGDTLADYKHVPLCQTNRNCHPDTRHLADPNRTITIGASPAMAALLVKEHWDEEGFTDFIYHLGTHASKKTLHNVRADYAKKLQDKGESDIQ